MWFGEFLLKRWAGQFGVRPSDIDFLTRAGKLGRPSRTLFPRDLIAQAASMNLRGLMNAAVIQSNLDWVWPYWAVRQFNPKSTSFTPRGFFPSSFNGAHRNWTAIGCLDSEREAVVDPRGLLTPLLNGWSLDFWLAENGRLVAPSQLENVHQHLEGNFPVVATEFEEIGIAVHAEAWATRVSNQEFVVERVILRNTTEQERDLTFFWAARPYNPEGISPIKDAWIKDQYLLINGSLGAYLTQKPRVAFCSNFKQGDVSRKLRKLSPGVKLPERADCSFGLATAAAGLDARLRPGEIDSFTILLPMSKMGATREIIEALRKFDYDAVKAQTILDWKGKLARGMQVALPDANLANSFEANKAYLLLLDDGKEITSGPLTDHRSRLRDAVYLVNALDKLGYHPEAERKLYAYTIRQHKDGFFGARDGEWDANGQAIWLLLEHFRLTGNRDFLAKVYPSIKKGIDWIERKRRSKKQLDGSTGKPKPVEAAGKSNPAEPAGNKTTASMGNQPAAPAPSLKPKLRSPHEGLLPPSFGAGDQGLFDYYYWDDFWALAAIREGEAAAEALGLGDEARRFERRKTNFWQWIEASLKYVEQGLGWPAIPASPYRRMDSGAIGSVCVLYPLRLLEPDDELIVNTVDEIRETMFFEDAFLQNVFYSGVNCSLSTHVAQSYLFRRSPNLWPVVRWLVRHSSETHTWPEAIHPVTRGGCMGDGHSGRTAANWLLLVRNILFFEEENRLVITASIPVEWVAPGQQIGVSGAPSYFGTIGYNITASEAEITLNLDCSFRQPPREIEWDLPVPVVSAVADGVPQKIAGGLKVVVPATARQVVVTRAR